MMEDGDNVRRLSTLHQKSAILILSHALS